MQMFATLIGGGFLTWTLGSYFTAKADQQKQLDNFVNSLAKLVIENNLYASKTGTNLSSPASNSSSVSNNQSGAGDEATFLVKPESFVAQAYVTNTLQAFNGPLILRDNGKKETVIKFLFGFQLLGHCDVSQPNKGDGECFPSKIPLTLADLDDIDFKNVGKNLSGINLSSVKLRKAKLRGAILSHAKFDDSQLQTSDFANSDLTQASFQRAYLQRANFKGAILDGVNFNGAMLCGSNFSDAIIKNSSFDRAYVDDSTILPLDERDKAGNSVSRLIRKPCFNP